MRSTFLTYHVANRAMETSQASINTTGNNIANINTDGYSRQRVDINSIYETGVTRYANKNIATGLGSKAMRVGQIRDPYLDARYRIQNGEQNKYNTLTRSLSNLEDVFDEATTQALQGELSSFVSDLQSLSQSPTSADIEQVVRSSAQKVTAIINMYANEMGEIRTQTVEDLKNTVNDDINVLIKNIASLNGQIRQEMVYGNTPNELYDQRNHFVDRLSGFANIKIATSPEVITPNLTIENYEVSLVDNAGNAIYLAYNEHFNELNFGQVSGVPVDPVNPPTGNKDIFVTDNIPASLAKANDATLSLNEKIIDGSLKALLDVINGAGSFAQTGENSFRGIAYYEQAMNVFSQTFADVFNGINTIDPLDPQPLFTNNTGTITTGITGANLQISKAWLTDPSYIVTTSKAAGEGTGNADNVLRMIAAMNNSQTFVKDPTASPTTNFYQGTFHEFMNGILGELSTDVELNGNFTRTADTVLQSLYVNRESISGVSLNEEGTYLMAFQKCYNAAARFFTVIDENVDTIINRMGRGGL